MVLIDMPIFSDNSCRVIFLSAISRLRIFFWVSFNFTPSFTPSFTPTFAPFFTEPHFEAAVKLIVVKIFKVEIGADTGACPYGKQ